MAHILKNCGPDDEPKCETSETGERLITKTEILRVNMAVGRRILEAFDFQPISEIVFQLKTDRGELHSVLKSERLPSVELLLAIQRVTGISVDWLLTGEGNKHISHPRPVLTDNVRQGPWTAGTDRKLLRSARD